MCKRLPVLISLVLVLGLAGSASALLNYEYYEAPEGSQYNALADVQFGVATPVRVGTSDTLDSGDGNWVEQAGGHRADDFGFRFFGYIVIPVSGETTFYLRSDDGSQLFINGTMVVDNDGLHGTEGFPGDPGTITLDAGVYAFEATQFERGGGDSIHVAWSHGGFGARRVPDSVLFTEPPADISVVPPTVLVETKAGNPNPGDGAVDVDVATLEWSAGFEAVSHKVYLSADETIDEADLAGETQLTIQIASVDPGVTYYWRVDEIDAGGNVVEGDVWTFSTIPLEAHFPVPADGAADLEPSTTLSWTAGKIVIMHDVYFGTDAAAVEARHPSTFKGKLMEASFDPGELELFTTYYWAVDQFAPPPTGTVAGPLWSFSTAEYILVEGGEATLDYDNAADPFVSELAWDVPLDVTAGGVLSDIALRFKGAPGNLSVDEATGTYEIAGAGYDVWGDHDEFHYVYKELTGDATIVTHVVDNGTGSNAWAKGGVMIRQNLAGGSTHALMAITGGNGGGGAFQWRPAADGSSSSAHDDAAGMAPGYWVKLERVGNALSGSYSADGVTWTQQGDAQTIEMADPVLIGLFVTSHQSGEIRTYTFDNVTIEGDVTADFVSADIDSVSGNSAEPVYVALEDMAGNVGVAAYPDPAATRIDRWWNLRVPMADLAAQGVDLTIASKLIFGVGSGAGGEAGAVTLADVMIVKPAAISETGDVTAPGDNVISLPFYNSPSHGREDPPMAIDDDVNAKYLNFEGAIQPSGIQIEPLVGPTIVTGLTLTTANDSPERDPAAFELYGSNESINGPYELIADGDVVDFIGADAWPRFTINATPIKFDNDVAYRFYQVLFPTVRDPGAANSMQIAEIELLAASGYAFEGDALDDTWDHDNGSDQWDGTGPGEGNPGGAVSLTEGDDTFLRIQDTGDPRDYGMGDPGSNRKVYLTRLTDISLDGLTIETRIRVATTGTLDDQHPDGGGGIAPWPAEGIGYHIRDGGKGMIGVSDGVGIISFSLARAGEPDFPDATSDVLVMNSLVGTEPTSDVDTGDAANAVALNVMAIDDATQWNTFVINIVAGGAGTHVVTISANGGPEESFDVTLGSDLEADSPFITIGSSGTGGITAFDVDYLSVSN